MTIQNGTKRKSKKKSEKFSFMEEPNLFQIFLSRLNKIDIRYMITGAVAVIIYGEPRLTQDIDLVVELKTNHIEMFGIAQRRGVSAIPDGDTKRLSLF